MPSDAVALVSGHSFRAMVTLEGLLKRKKRQIDRVPFSDFDLIPRSQICHDCYLKACQPKAPRPGCTSTFISKKLRREMFAAVRTPTGKAPPINDRRRRRQRISPPRHELCRYHTEPVCIKVDPTHRKA